MQSLILFMFSVLASTPSAFPSAQVVTDSSHPTAEGGRVLQQSLEVPAPIADVWQALSTSEGLQSWAVPVAAIDLRLGGIWESSYRLDAKIGDPSNIRNEILAYLPPRLLVIQAIQAPPDFPFRELLQEIFTVIECREIGRDRTRVTVSMVGYRDGDGFDVLYGRFERGNAWTLQQLQRRFRDGPMNWQALSVVDSGDDEYARSRN